MWISKKKYKELEKRIADLEVRVQSQQKISVDKVVDSIIKANERLKSQYLV